MAAVRLGVLLVVFLSISRPLHCLAIPDDAARVSIEAIPLLTEVEQGKTSQQSVMLRLQSPEIPHTNQEIINAEQDLIVVLDVSGSMRQGGKLAKAKAAISGIVKSLRATDRLHLITYHSHARVEFTGGTADKKEELLAQIAELTPQMSTNLYAGLQKAEKILQPGMFSSVKSMFGSASDSSSASLKRIFLFSDGLVNEGVTNRHTILQKVESLRQQGTTTSAFGIGADYDQELMSAIAEAGHGEFFFIRGQEDMEKVIGVATAGFRNLFATEAKVHLTALNSATDLHVNGPGTTRGESLNSMHVSLGDLRAGDSRTVLVDLLLPSLDETTEYLAYEVEYLATGTSEPTRQGGHVSVRVVPGGTQTAEPNKAVLLFRKLQRHLLREKDIEQEIESGTISRASSLEDDLEEDLKDVAGAACATQNSRDEVYTCSRAKAAWSRTKQSQGYFSSLLSFSSPSRSMASNAYKFKRQMNAELSELKDEL